MLCDKPLAMNEEECQQALGNAEKSVGLKGVIAFE
ncbi:hypothetical protein [Tetragenococcus halophilus]